MIKIRIATLIIALSAGLYACTPISMSSPPPAEADMDSSVITDDDAKMTLVNYKDSDSDIIETQSVEKVEFPNDRITLKKEEEVAPSNVVEAVPAHDNDAPNNKSPEEVFIEAVKITNDNTPYEHRETIVSRKVSQLSEDMDKIQTFVKSYQDEIAQLQANSEQMAAEYYGYVASIQSRLQGGSTPGNPILVENLQKAQKKLDKLAQDVGELNKLANDISSNASVASFLLESVRATYNLSGAIEEDHEKLTDLEDDLNHLIVKIDRQLNELSDDVNRRASYLATERRNIQTLALAVANGEPYGQSLARKAFGPVSTLTGQTSAVSSQPLSPPGSPERSARFSGTRPLVVIRFDRPKVDYQQALYMAANQALDKFPDAFFEIVAVTPARGNPAQRALASSDARQNAEQVFRNLVQMGVPSQRLKLSAAQSPEAGTPEVHVFVR